MTAPPVAGSVRGGLRLRSPYVGLVPYDESEAAYFFGRSIEVAIVAANLRASRLTILYGPSGVGKSSLLMAGAVHSLREEARTEAADVPFAVCVFRSWRGDAVGGLLEAARAALHELAGAEPLPGPGRTLAETLRTWVDQTGTLLVVLDQFEEYFQYHPDAGDGESLTGFAAELAGVVNAPGLAVNVLISIREDAWARLDRFEGHVPALFANYVRVDHLGIEAAREAIEAPIEAWNRSLPGDERPFRIEPALVEAVISATASGGLTLNADGQGPKPAAADGQSPEPAAAGDRVEAPFLQLVLDRLWRETIASGDHTLSLARLKALGGAARIVESHLRDALGRLTPGEQDAASDCFRFLVSASKTKIAHTASDLAAWTERPEAELTAVLDKLCSSENGRILRAVAPAQGEGSMSYELFHDILAEPVVAWRKQVEQRRERDAAAQRQRALRRRVVIVGSVVLGLAAVFAALAALAALEWRHADHQRRRADQLLQVQQDSNRELRARIKTDAQLLGARRKSDQTLTQQVRALRAAHGRLSRETARLLAARSAVNRQIRLLRTTNLRLGRTIDRLNAANVALARKTIALREKYAALQAAQEALLQARTALQANAATLAAERRALNAQARGLGRERIRLLERLAALGLPPPSLASGAPQSAVSPELEFPPLTAAQFHVPGDVAGSDALRRKVELLERQLAQQLAQRAKLTDEAGWLRKTNALLTQERDALRTEAVQLEQTRTGLEARERALQQASRRAGAENRRLSALAASWAARTRNENKKTTTERRTNTRRQEANNRLVDSIGAAQKANGATRRYNQRIADEITPHLSKLLQGARDLRQRPEVAALLAVAAERIAPYEPDDPGHPGAYNALWTALNRLDAQAAHNLVEAPRSSVVAATLCALLGPRQTSGDMNRILAYLPPSATPSLRRPCA